MPPGPSDHRRQVAHRQCRRHHRAGLFDEAQRRDHARTWIALVDGNNHQIDQIKVHARARQVPATIIIESIHVLDFYE